MISWRSMASKLGFEIPFHEMEEPMSAEEQKKIVLWGVTCLVLILIASFILDYTSVLKTWFAADAILSLP